MIFRQMINERQSNFELLRCIAIFMIIAVHADYWLLGVPTLYDLKSNPLGTFWKVFWECVTIVGANIFVLISGWFSIRPTLKSFLSFIFQIEFFLLGVYFVGVLTGLTEFSLKSIAICFLFSQHNWFIKAYIGLYILAPILNAFIEKVKKEQLVLTIVLFFLFQTVYGWTRSAAFVELGYSTFSFIGLYLLARYIRIYKWNLWGGWIILLSTCINIILSVYAICMDNEEIGYIVIAYVNPLVIIGSVGWIILFSRLELGSNVFINKIGKSTFSVFLFPCWYISEYIYHVVISDVYNSTSGIKCFLLILGVLISVFCAAIVVDQLRIFLWKFLWKHLSPYIEKDKLSKEQF